MQIRHAILLSAAIAMTLVACGANQPPPAPVTTSAPVHPGRGAGAMRPMRPSTMSAKLTAAGLDPKHLPPIETLDRKTKLRVMRTFTEALGVACVDCHGGVDFAVDTRRKRVAKRMWNEITRVVAQDSGEPMYCDSCHQGDLFILDRHDESKVRAFMTDEYDEKLKRTDGREHGCGTCHGSPPDYEFLTAWRNAPAPDIHPVTP